MKRFLIYLASFIVLFLAFQWGAGLILTATYSLDLSEAWEASANAPREVTITGGAVDMTLAIALVAAAISYFIPKLVEKSE
ncbi:hypothetical protein [Alkalibacillus aidingensis]|uniref:hypothetical protein n=1 Tax=Alkalibacillus aidingensis TaxID=2747607 RepID=UPI00166125A1|nr:hypothetical protein [Alkalibacillus aidingensis]